MGSFHQIKEMGENQFTKFSLNSIHHKMCSDEKWETVENYFFNSSCFLYLEASLIFQKFINAVKSPFPLKSF
jgi:hypothetical protein